MFIVQWVSLRNRYDVDWNHYPATVQAQYHKAINEARMLITEEKFLIVFDLNSAFKWTFMWAGIEAGVIQKPIFGVNRPG